MAPLAPVAGKKVPPPLPPSPDFPELLLGSGRKIRKETIFLPENGISREKNQHPLTAYTPPGTILQAVLPAFADTMTLLAGGVFFAPCAVN